MAPSDSKHEPEAPTVSPGGSTGQRQLVIFEASGVRRIDLPARGRLTLGRGRDCDVRFDDPAVSRQHAALLVDASLEIEDLGGSSRVAIDGRALAPREKAALEVGALVTLGSARLLVGRAPSVGPRPKDSPMERVRRLVDVVASGSISVLLLGETGVGKEVLAEAIHRRSPRSAGPFIRFSCAALPDALLESELFGHERGAFTGAVQAKPGLLEAADGGTAFLDEVGEIPLGTQAKLLRVLESRELLRVGALKPRPIDVRFVAATNRELRALVDKGGFRGDLYFRLNGITIQIPPLRERLDEVPELATLFVRDASARAGRPEPAIRGDAMDLLSSYRWPGNVRELRNVIDRAMLLCGAGPLGVEHLMITEEGQAAAPAVPRAEAAGPETATVQPPPPDSERAQILAALERCAGNQKEAAKMLGMTRRMLMYRMDRLALPRPRKGSPTQE
jgi:two-component system response regulator AtoC